MPRLVDTTIRLLSQEPLAGKVPTADLLRLAEVLDTAGFACLEVSGGGVFDSAVRRGRREPVGADPRAQGADDDAARARAARPLPRRLAAGRRRLRAPLRRLGGRERDRRLPAARPAERRLQPPRGGRGDRRRRQGVPCRARLQPRRRGRDRRARRAGEASCRSSARPARSIHDPTGGLEPHQARRARRRVAEASGLPVGFYCQGAAGSGLADSIEAARAGADLIACARLPARALAPPRRRGVARLGARRDGDRTRAST